MDTISTAQKRHCCTVQNRHCCIVQSQCVQCSAVQCSTGGGEVSPIAARFNWMRGACAFVKCGTDHPTMDLCCDKGVYKGVEVANTSILK